MIKATKYYISVVLALLCCAFSANAQYVGGSGNLSAADSYSLTSCSTPPQFMAYFGGAGNLNMHGEANYATCTNPPSQFFAYMGGSNDGSALLTHTTTACTTPAQLFAYMGGSNDGSSLLTYTTTSCGTPTQFFAYMGGIADGAAVTTFTQCSTNPPVAQFSVSTQTVCVGSAISYSDASQYNPVSWNWTFAGATPSVSTVQNPNVVYNTPGVYSVSLTVTNAFGSNTLVQSNYITVNSLPTVDAGNNVTVCSGNATVLNASGASSYSWSPGTGLSSATIANPVANPASTTIYTVTGTQNGCSKTDVVTVSVTAAPVANAGPDLNLCTGSTLTINASGGGTYSWLPAQGLSSTTSANPVVSTTNTTTYTLTVSNGACSDADVITVTIKPLPTADAGSDVTICNGASTVLNASGGTSYTWAPAGSLNFPNSVSPTATPGTTTNYTLTVNDGTCSAKDIVTVSVTPLPAANAGTDFTICTGGTATLNASGGTSYTWTPATGLSATNISNPVSSTSVTTDYTVTVANATGCTATDVTKVTVLSAPTANAGSDVSVCPGSSGTLNASGGTSYLWTPATGLSSNTVANPVVTTTNSITYTVSVSNGACSATDAVNVNVMTLPNVNAGSDVVACSGSSVSLNGSGGVTYTWSPTQQYDFSSGFNVPIMTNPNSTSPLVYPIYSSTNFTLTASNGSCTATDVVNVTMVAPPNPSAGSNVVICVGNTTSLNASGGSSYTWTPAYNITNVTIPNPDVNPASTTQYTVNVGNGVCTRTAAVTVSVQTTPFANAGADINLCHGSSATLNATGGVGYVWTPATGLTNPSISNPVVTTTNTTSYTVTVTNAGGCSASDVMVVNALAKPAVDAGLNQAICQGNSVVLNGTGASSFTWSPSASLDFPNSISPTATPGTTTIYTLTTSNGTCTANDVVTVSVTPLPNADAGNSITICNGATATFSASGGTAYSWSPATALSSTTIANPVANPTITTQYTVTVTNNGCTASDVIDVTVTNSLIADAGTNTVICNGSAAILNASGGSTYSWAPSTGLSSTTAFNPSASPSVTTVYTLTAYSGACSATDEVTVTVNAVPVATVSASGPTTFCNGNNVVLTSSPGSSYLWSNGLTAQSITVTTSGNYSVAVSNGSCSANSGITAVTVNTTGVASITPGGPTTFCQGGNVTLTANAGNGYNWSTGAGTQTINVTASGIYTVTVDDINGCASSTASLSITVNPNPATPSVTAGGVTSLCFGDNVILSSDAADHYLWSTGAVTQTISVSTAGSYSVTNYNSFGCGALSPGINVSVNDPLADFVATPTLVFIPNAAVNFSATVTGVAPYTYAWEFGDGGTSALASPTHTYNSVAYRTVTLTVTDDTGCSKALIKTDYIEVEQLFPSTLMNTGTTIDITGVSFVDGATGIASLADGNCLISVDSGKVWSPLPTSNTEPLTGVHTMPGKWFATGQNGTILFSSNSGGSWVPMTTGTTETFNGSHFSGANNGFAVGKNGTIHKYDGTNWSPETSGSIEHLHNVFAFSNGNAIAVGDNQTILSYDGTSWTPQSSPLNFHIKDVRFTTLQNGYAAGTNGIILQTNDGGANWLPSLTGVDIDFNSIEARGTDTAWATGSNGIIYRTVNNGANWERYSVGYTSDQSQLRMSPGKGHVVGQGGNGKYFDASDGDIITAIAPGPSPFDNLSVYPNPARDQFTISGYLNSTEKVTIDLKDAQGKLVQHITNASFSGQYAENISTEYYSPGIYFIHLQIGKRSMVKKLVIMK
jgi:PKD repeat protein